MYGFSRLSHTSPPAMVHGEAMYSPVLCHGKPADVWHSISTGSPRTSQPALRNVSGYCAIKDGVGMETPSLP